MNGFANLILITMFYNTHVGLLILSGNFATIGSEIHNYTSINVKGEAFMTESYTVLQVRIVFSPSCGRCLIAASTMAAIVESNP